MKLALFFSYILSTAFLQAQTGYVVNDATGDFPVSKIINYSAPSSTFQQLKKKLVIVDFFGTWCVPCVRALPKLSALQEKYKNEMTILLVSEEPQAKLETFLKKQTNFIFPIVVDEEKNFVTRFQPPSYPYTVIVGKNGKVLAIPSLEEITEDYINKWLKEQEISSGPVTNKISKIDTPQVTLINYNKKEEVEASQNKLVQLSQEFMYAAKTAAVTSTFIAELKNISLDEIRSTIKTDDDKKAFWINL